jgi:hypothetical protein
MQVHFMKLLHTDISAQLYYRIEGLSIKLAELRDKAKVRMKLSVCFFVQVCVK